MMGQNLKRYAWKLYYFIMWCLVVEMTFEINVYKLVTLFCHYVFKQIDIPFTRILCHVNCMLYDVQHQNIFQGTPSLVIVTDFWTERRYFFATNAAARRRTCSCPQYSISTILLSYFAVFTFFQLVSSCAEWVLCFI